MLRVGFQTRRSAGCGNAGQGTKKAANMGQERTLNLTDMLGFEQADSPRKSRQLEESIVELYASMRPSLLGYACQVVGSKGEGEDLVQIAFLKLFDQMKPTWKGTNLKATMIRRLEDSRMKAASSPGAAPRISWSVT